MTNRGKKQETRGKREAEDLQALRETLAPLDERCPLPYALKGEIVMQKAGEPSHRSRAVPLRRAAACLAALAVIAGSVAASNMLRSGPGSDVSPQTTRPAIDEALDEVSMGNYGALEQAFLRMHARRESEKRMYLWGVDEMTMEAEDMTWPEGMTWEQTMPAAETMEMKSPPMDRDPAEDNAFNIAGNEAADFGTTNVQVRGVDEADILKNDGRYFYYVTSNYNGAGTLYILRALPADGMKVLSSMAIPGYRHGTELYVQGDRMALVYTEYPPGGDVCASVQVYDIGDREAPKMVKSFSQRGNLLSSRLVDGRVYLISTQWANLNFRVMDGGAIPEEDILPRVYNNGEEVLVAARDIAVLPGSEEPSYLVISSLDLLSETTRTENAAILGAGSQVYCTSKALYIASQQYLGIVPLYGDSLARSMPMQGGSDSTRIYRFSLLPDGKIQAAGQGEVPGWLLNQFSMDEFEGHFRLATTARNGRGESMNIVNILDSDLNLVGAIDNLAPGETIQSVRFMGSTGYVVTFRQTDPLFVIDLADPKNPKVLGELKIPGFSAYLHPWDATHLIGVGPDGDDRGANGNVKISLFDISDPAKPKEVSKAVVKNCWTDIQQNHKAFVLCAEKGAFGLPLQGDYGVTRFHTFRVQGGKVSLVHSLRGPDSTDYYWGWPLRGTYIADNWYVLGSTGAIAYGMADGKPAGEVKF